MAVSALRTFCQGPSSDAAVAAAISELLAVGIFDQSLSASQIRPR